ncbi:cylicin-2-like [Daphnia carinata]|uniref:cylicin-2-like n=1 Tax=Daphnia carinata TaxID=120202 RepID=UPI00257CC138|nr:cylicin-2-like [Daphnia carinata]
MSSPSSITSTENSNKKAEDSHLALKQEPSIVTDDGVKNNSAVAKTEQPAQPPVTNGALAESEVKVVGNGLESSTNGQEEKPVSDGPHREVPALLPLGPITSPPSTVQQSTIPSLSPNPPARQPLPQLLPMNATTAPVVATKSAPPPPPPSNPVAKTRARTSLSVSTPASSSKEQSPSGPSTRSKKEDEEPVEQPVPEKEIKKRKIVSKKRHSVASSDSTEKGDIDSGGDGDAGRKSKRARTRTQPFQSSDMDVNLLRVMKASAAAQAAAAAQVAKANEEKLVVFFKGEFLAVRNAEGGFYICQATQNICRGGHKIRIRWLSQEDTKNKKKAKASGSSETVKDESGFDIYTPDFYDNTDFECILTNLELEKLGRDRYGLPLDERQRTENILRRAIEVEQGVVDKLELTEEHPDGLDVSLFHDESQLKRKCDDSSSESESDSKEEVATTSGSSAKSSQSTEPRTSTSGIASTSSGRGTKRTRAAVVAATRQKLQLMRYQEDDDDDDEEEDSSDDDDIEGDDSSSDSEQGKRGRRRRSRPVPAPKARVSVRSTRGKKLVPPKKAAPIPMIMKRTKASFKEAVEVTSNRKKVERVTVSPPSPIEKVVTVDVEMGDNDASPVEEEPKEIKLDAVMAEETESGEEKDAKKTKKAETKSADAKSEIVVTEVKTDSKNNDTNEVKDGKKEVPAKSEKDAVGNESLKAKTEKGAEDAKEDVKVVETKE